jgi:putative ABC transport system ATP-binding protein
MSSNSRDNTTSGPLIRANGLAKVFQNGAGSVPVLSGIDLDVYPGEMVAIMGPSGSGKSTLLFILGLLLSPSRGSYTALGEDMLKLGRHAQAEFRRKRFGFVFQSCNLIENSTVYENVEMPLIYGRVRTRERSHKIAEALSKANLSNRLHHRSNCLSGGEQQRVAIARAMVNDPNIIFADEPTGQLDHGHTQLIMGYFRQFVENENTAVIIVTHDHEVASACTRVCRLEYGTFGSRDAF